MENREILLAFLPSLFLAVVAVLVYSGYVKLNPLRVVVQFVVPLVVGGAMYGIFLVGRSGTVRQLSGSSRGRDLWSLWAGLWPVLLLVVLLSGVAILAWVVVSVVQRRRRAWLPVGVVALGMHVFAFFTVGYNFPDA
ncbi:MAG: hypothetical protein KDA31_06670 [Phycisphaerales bacterium]|nr:hypothetical protein [Phycisphaerales bacterium]